jgi:hypothetical protein
VSTYQDVVNDSFPYAAWALVEAAGTDFVPYTGALHLTGAGVNQYQQTGPFAASESLHLNSGKLTTTTNLPITQFFTLEAWFNLDATTRAGNALLLYLGGNAASNGWGVYVPTGNNNLHIFFASPTHDVDTGVAIGASAWHLLQCGNLAGVTGELDVGLDGQVVGSFRTPDAQAAPSGGWGIGGTPGQASNTVGFVAMPAAYTQQQSQLNWRSRFIASTDPNAAVPFTISGAASNIASTDATVNAILAAVRKAF